MLIQFKYGVILQVFQKTVVNKNLIGIYDIFGREIPETQNKLLFFKYTDGTIEKRLLLK